MSSLLRRLSSVGNKHEMVLFFTTLCSPIVLCQIPLPRLGSGSLNCILGRYYNSQVISHYSDSVQLKFPIAFVIQNFPFQHLEPDSGLHRKGGLACFATLPSSLFGSPGGDWLIYLWALSSSLFSSRAEEGRKKKGKRIASLI